MTAFTRGVARAVLAVFLPPVLCFLGVLLALEASRRAWRALRALRRDLAAMHGELAALLADPDSDERRPS
jgi:hypothetical protein